jgi:hypothetical protein
MNCQNCGFDLPNDAMFCGNCGAKIEPRNNENEVGNIQSDQPIHEEATVGQDEAINLPDEVAKVQEGNNSQEVPPSPEISQEEVPIPNKPVETQEFNTMKNEPNKKSKLPVIIVGALVGVLCVAIIVLLITSLGGSSSNAGSMIDSEKAPAFYNDGGDLYVLYPGDTEGEKLIEDIDRDYWNLVVVDEDTFYYIEDDELYFKEGNKEPEKIYDDAHGMKVSQSGDKVAFCNDDNELLLYNGKEVLEICDEDDCNAYVVFSDNEKIFAFTYEDEDKHGYDVAIPCIWDGEEYTKLDFEEDDYEFSYFLGISKDYVYYVAFDLEKYNNILFRAALGGDAEEIADEVSDSDYFNNDTLAYIQDGDLYYYDGEDGKKIEKNIVGMDRMSSDDDVLLLFDYDQTNYIWKPGLEDALEIKDSDENIDYDFTEGGETYIFSTEDELIVVEFNGKKLSDPDVYDIKDIQWVSLHEDNKTALLYDDDNTLYTYKIGDDDATEILDDVVNQFAGWGNYYFPLYKIGDNNNLVTVNEDDDVYYYTGKEAEKVGEDYADSLVMLPDGKSYGYLDDKYDFYFGQNGHEVENIEDDIDYMYVMGTKYIYLINEDDEVLLYKAGDDEAEKTDIEVDEWYSIYEFLNY